MVAQPGRAASCLLILAYVSFQCLLAAGSVLNADVSIISMPQQVQQQQAQLAPGASHTGAAKPTGDSSSSSSRIPGSQQHGLPGEADPASERMLDWIRANGGEANVAIRRVPGKGRGTYAPKAFAVGDVMARIPVELLYANHNRQTPEEIVGASLLTAMAQPDSAWRPYFDALPGPSEVVCAVNIPPSYLPVIQDPKTEYSIRLSQFELEELWRQQGPKHLQLLAPNLSVRNLTYAVGLLRTRQFRFDSADVLLPIVDMANHVNGCPHIHVPEPCDPDQGRWQWEHRIRPPRLSEAAGSGLLGPHSSGQCMVWRAGEPLVEGQEVCNCYGKSLQDRSLLQYGFLQSGPVAQELSMIDKAPGYQQRDSWFTKFQGTLSQIWAEIDRLVARLTLLQSGDAAASAIRPDAEADPDGHFLSLLKEWRRQRQVTIQAEINRLYNEADSLKDAFDVWLAREVEGGADAVAAVQQKAAFRAGSSHSSVKASEAQVHGLDPLGVSAADAYVGIPGEGHQAGGDNQQTDQEPSEHAQQSQLAAE